MTEQKSVVRVKRIPQTKDDGTVAISIKFRVDPKVIGPEQMEKIWKGVGQLLRELLTPDEQQELLRQMGTIQKKLKKKEAKA